MNTQEPPFNVNDLPYLSSQNFPFNPPRLTLSYLLNSDALCTNDPMEYLPIFLINDELTDQIELGGRVVDALIETQETWEGKMHHEAYLASLKEAQ